MLGIRLSADFYIDDFLRKFSVEIKYELSRQWKTMKSLCRYDNNIVSVANYGLNQGRSSMGTQGAQPPVKFTEDFWGINPPFRC